MQGDSFQGAGVAGDVGAGTPINVNSMTGVASLTGAQSANAPLTVASAGLANGWIDVGGFDCLDITATVIGTGITTVLVQASNDLTNNPNGNNLTGISASSATPTIVSTLLVNTHAVFAITSRYVRVILNGTQSALTTTVGYCFKAGFPVVPQMSVTSTITGSPNVSPFANTSSGGATTYRNLGVGTTGANIKGSAGNLYGGTISNTVASLRYLKLYNKATAPTVGTDTPLMTIPIPGTSTIPLPMNAIPAAFSLGIGIGASTAIADADTSAPGTNDVVVNLLFA